MMTFDQNQTGLFHPESLFCRYLKYFWIFIFWGIGTIGIIYFKQLGLRQEFVTLFPLVVMIIYLLSVCYIPIFKLNPGIAGDNVYYLGFLFTLVSLAIALVVFQQDGTGELDIVRNFGIALTTTIFGLITRVYMHQFDLDQFQLENDVQLNLYNSTQKVKREMDYVVKQIRNIRLNIDREIQDGYKHTQKSVDETVKAFQTQFNETHQSFAVCITNILTNLNSRNEEFSKSHETYINAMDSLSYKIQEISVPKDFIRDELEEWTSGIQEATTRLSSATINHEQELEKHLRSTKNLSENTQKIEASVERLNQFSNSLTALEDQLRQLTTSSIESQERVMETMSKLSESIEELSKTVHNHNTEFDRDLKQSRNYTRAVHESLSSMAELLAKELGSNSR